MRDLVLRKGAGGGGKKEGSPFLSPVSSPFLFSCPRTRLSRSLEQAKRKPVVASRNFGYFLRLFFISTVTYGALIIGGVLNVGVLIFCILM